MCAAARYIFAPGVRLTNRGVRLNCALNITLIFLTTPHENFILLYHITCIIIIIFIEKRTTPHGFWINEWEVRFGHYGVASWNLSDEKVNHLIADKSCSWQYAVITCPSLCWQLTVTRFDCAGIPSVIRRVRLPCLTAFCHFTRTSKLLPPAYLYIVAWIFAHRSILCCRNH